MMISDAIAISIVAFAISVSMCKIFAKKHEYEVDANQVSERMHLFIIFNTLYCVNGIDNLILATFKESYFTKYCSSHLGV